MPIIAKVIKLTNSHYGELWAKSCYQMKCYAVIKTDNAEVLIWNYIYNMLLMAKVGYKIMYSM